VILFSTLFWFSFFGKFAFGALSDKIPKQRVFLITSCILFIGSLLLFEINNGQLSFTQNRAQLTIFTILFGLGFGGSFSMIQLVALEIFGKAYLGRILGLISLVDGMGAALGTKLLSELKISTGSYFVPFTLVSLVTLFAIINVFLIKPIQTKSQTTS
jgi:MFS family permease